MESRMSAQTSVKAESRIVAPGPQPRTVRNERGEVEAVPLGWMLLPPGDAGLTRRVKAAGATWTVQERVRRKLFSRGVWASGTTIEACRKTLEAERSTEAYAKKRVRDTQRREEAQSHYVTTFRESVLQFLAFAQAHEAIAQRLADAVTNHATPVGSGTVARTQRIPVEERAEAAVIAWMRHQTTAYERMTIPRVKGQRREVRRMLAQRSHQLLMRYRSGEAVDALKCPLQKALR
jgi:hypothetical protein